MSHIVCPSVIYRFFYFINAALTNSYFSTIVYPFKRLIIINSRLRIVNRLVVAATLSEVLGAKRKIVKISKRYNEKVKIKGTTRNRTKYVKPPTSKIYLPTMLHNSGQKNNNKKQSKQTN